MLSLTCVLHPDKKEYEILKSLCRASKNLYNSGLYQTRQHLFLNNAFLKYPENYHLCKENENYKFMQSASAQQTLKFVERNMRSYYSLKKLADKGKVDPPSLPRYLKKDGYFMVAYPKNGFSIKGNKIELGTSRLHGKGNKLSFMIPKPIRKIKHKIQEIHILPAWQGKFFRIKYIYEETPQDLQLNPDRVLGIDLGLDNFATLVGSDGTATIISGKYIKSYNRWFNKEKAKIQSQKDLQGYKHCTAKEIQLSEKRYNVINEFLNQSVNLIVKQCIKNDIGTVIIGDFEGAKTGINHGRKNNQNFVSVPYYKFKAKLESKCQQYGIQYKAVNESYTSKCDALALEPVHKHESYLGKRNKRGLFQSSTGVLLNADVNGALNILRKVSGDSPVKEIISSGLVNRPVTVYLCGNKLNCVSSYSASPILA